MHESVRSAAGEGEEEEWPEEEWEQQEMEAQFELEAEAEREMEAETCDGQGVLTPPELGENTEEAATMACEPCEEGERGGEGGEATGTEGGATGRGEGRAGGGSGDDEAESGGTGEGEAGEEEEEWWARPQAGTSATEWPIADRGESSGRPGRVRRQVAALERQLMKEKIANAADWQAATRAAEERARREGTRRTAVPGKCGANLFCLVPTSVPCPSSSGGAVEKSRCIVAVWVRMTQTHHSEKAGERENLPHIRTSLIYTGNTAVPYELVCVFGR